ncbi:tyrosine-type recombinase/integrase [Leifsonia xyli]
MRLKPNSLATTESLMRNWIVPLLGRRRISELKPSDVRLVHKAVFDAGLATSTARKAHEILMRHAQRREGRRACDAQRRGRREASGGHREEPSR